MHVLVVDDHPLILQGVVQLLPHLAPDVEVSCAEDRAQAEIKLDNDPEIELVLLDLGLKETHGLDFLADIKLDYPGVDVVVLSGSDDRATVMAAMAAGARGFITKASSSEKLAAALSRVLAGETWISPDVGHSMENRGTNLPLRELGLTAREIDVAVLLAKGRSNKVVCRTLGLSEGTVKVHVSSILKKLQVQSRAQLVVEFARRGINPEMLAASRRS